MSGIDGDASLTDSLSEFSSIYSLTDSGMSGISVSKNPAVSERVRDSISYLFNELNDSGLFLVISD
ncbi:hypothetical protein [Endozoicomonas sp. SESOKO1]|uniref:hypothetical protein n=1 Tax=Endozoicomonas sp. SESOKO1 TaxID=2828742 RepID=UPI002148DDD3|nr:hypothetical protein [Endozoicomonas sp. SESOKO1]